MDFSKEANLPQLEAGSPVKYFDNNKFFLSELCLLKLPISDTPLTLTPANTKRIIVAVCTLASICSPFQTSIILPAMGEISVYYNTSLAKVNISFGAYLLALGIFPMYHSSFSDKYGKRPVYIFAFLGFAIMCLLACVSSPTIDSFIGLRFLCGAFGSCVQTLGIGSVADLYKTEERGFVIGLFYLGSLTAPMIAPIVGSALCDSLGWKSTQWFVLGMALFALICVVLFLPETNRTKNKQAENKSKCRDTNILNILFIYLVRPWKIVNLLIYPPFLITCLCASVTSSIVYYSNMFLEQTLSSSPYNFKPLYIGLCYIPISAGYILAAVTGGKYIDKRLQRDKEKNCGFTSPQARLSYNIVLAVLLIPIGLLLQGWCSQYHVVWPVILVGTFFLGISAMLIMGSIASYLTDELDGSSKGVALNNLCRQTCSSIACFTANKAVKGLGIGNFSVLLSVVGLLSGLLILVIKHKKNHFEKDYDLQKIVAKTD